MSELSEAAGVVVEVIRRIAEAFDRQDLDALFGEHFQGSESSIIAQAGERVVGWEAVQAELELRVREFDYSRTTVKNPLVSVFGNIAVVTYEQLIDSRLHDIEFKWRGWVTDHLILQDGKWLRMQHHASEQSQR